MFLFRNLPLYVLFLCALLLGACGGTDSKKSPSPSAPDRPTEECPGVFLFGPSRYVISLVAGEVIVLDPARYPIPVYCTADQARKAAKEAHSSGKAPASMDLRVYQLEGDWHATVRKDGDKYYLNTPAAIIDSVE